MRAAGHRDLVVECMDCRHERLWNADELPDDTLLVQLGQRMVCGVCGHRGADVRPRPRRIGATRHPYAEARPQVVALAKSLRESGMTLKAISAELASRGYLTRRGKPYAVSAVQAMLA